MVLRICYVLAADECALYPDLAYLSAASFRAVHPRDEIVLVWDEQTARRHERGSRRLLDLCTDVVTAPAPPGDVVFRSRWLKIRLRGLVAGELLFLDADTLVARPLHGIRRRSGDILAALDSSPSLAVGTPPAWAEEFYARHGLRCAPGQYRNAGVVLWRDTARAHRFAARHAELHDRLGVDIGGRDQPLFNVVASEEGSGVADLPGSYNASIQTGPVPPGRAHIWHFWTNDWMNVGLDSRYVRDMLLGHLVWHYRRTGEIDHAALERARSMNYPMLAEQGVRHRLLWGSYLGATRLATRRLIGRYRR
jgi:hypothetical protein